jgi:MFS family permease
VAPAAEAAGTVWRRCVLVGLGGLFVGVTGPLISNFVPPLVSEVVGGRPAIVGGIMAIDNVLLLLLVPWAGAMSDRATARRQGRVPIVLTGLAIAAAGMALFPASAALGLAGLIGAMIALHAGINLQRSPFQALVADVLPSRERPLATASSTFQMCIGAIVFLMLGRVLGMAPAFFWAAGAVVAIAVALRLWLREPAPSASSTGAAATAGSLVGAATAALRGVFPGMRAIVVSLFLLQLTFQSFTTWYALHGMERFGVRPEDVTIGFIAWAVGGGLGALPAGFIGVRIGRRNTMLAGFALMAICLLALDRVTDIAHATPLLALASAAWALPTVNAYPLFVEPLPRAHRGTLAALFLLCMALGGGIGDPLNGALFDLFDSYRALFLMMAVYTGLAFLAVLAVPKGAGEAGTDPAE